MPLALIETGTRASLFLSAVPSLRPQLNDLRTTSFFNAFPLRLPASAFVRRQL